MPDILKKDNKINSVHREDGAKRYGVYSYQDVLNFLNYMYSDATIYLERKYALYIDFLTNGSKYHKKILYNCRLL